MIAPMLYDPSSYAATMVYSAYDLIGSSVLYMEHSSGCEQDCLPPVCAFIAAIAMAGEAMKELYGLLSASRVDDALAEWMVKDRGMSSIEDLLNYFVASNPEVEVPSNPEVEP